MNRGVFLDLGCGIRKEDGHIGIDTMYLDGVDIVADVNVGLPLKDNTVDGIYSNYFMEHVHDLVAVFQEIYRVCKNRAKVTITVPYYASINAFKDPTHKQFFTEETFKYFSRDKWYGSDYEIKTDFKVLNIKYHYSNLIRFIPFIKKYLIRHIFNSVGAMTVGLEVVKDEK